MRNYSRVEIVGSDFESNETNNRGIQCFRMHRSAPPIIKKAVRLARAHGLFSLEYSGLAIAACCRIELTWLILLGQFYKELLKAVVGQCPFEQTTI